MIENECASSSCCSTGYAQVTEMYERIYNTSKLMKWIQLSSKTGDM